MASWYFKPYFLANYFLILFTFPLFKYYVEQYKSNKDFYYENTTERESHILASFATIILIRYFRYFTNFQMLVNDSLFYVKVAYGFIFLFINLKYFIWYMILVIVAWILVKIPYYDGPSKVIPIHSKSSFDEYVVNNVLKKKHVYSLVVFYSQLSDKCTFVNL